MQTLKEFKKELIGLQGNMLNFALTLTINKEAAKDLTQETNLRTLDNLDKYKDNRNFKGWVFTVMHNIFVNNYRKKVRANTMVDQTDNLYYLNLSQNSGLDSPDGAYAYSEMINILNSLDNDYKTPFSMYLAGYKYTEIADIMGVPLGTIKSRIFFARKKLQIILID